MYPFEGQSELYKSFKSISAQKSQEPEEAEDEESDEDDGSAETGEPGRAGGPDPRGTFRLGHIGLNLGPPCGSGGPAEKVNQKVQQKILTKSFFSRTKYQIIIAKGISASLTHLEKHL